MHQQVPFIGRSAELSAIHSAVRAHGTRRVLCIDAAGGIGKTRLLHEVRRRYQNDESLRQNLIIVEGLDFDDRALRSPRNIERRIAQTLDPALVAPYYDTLQDWFHVEAGLGISRDRLDEAEYKVMQTFVACFNAATAQQRALLLFDTTETLTNSETWHYLQRLLSQLENCVVLFAGRTSRVFADQLAPLIGSAVQVIDLPAFPQPESATYLGQKESLLNIRVEPDLAEKLLLLAAGRPILIDLATEWRARGIMLNWIIELSLDQLRSLDAAALSQYRQEFERQLVQHIAETREPLDWLILTLAHVYPLDARLAGQLLGLEPAQATLLLDEARSYVFIKDLAEGAISLQDEMRRMVNAYVWPEVDPDGERRRRDSRIAAQLFGEAISVIDQQIAAARREQDGDTSIFLARSDLIKRQEVLWLLTVEHALVADLESGFRLFEETLQRARVGRRSRFARQLYTLGLSMVSKLNAEQQFRLQLLHARLLYDEGNIQESQPLLESLLEANPDNRERQASIYNALAACAVRAGAINDALREQNRALSLFQELGLTTQVPAAANYLGYIYRMQGDWKRSLDYYRLALDVALRVETPDANTVASTLNNIGYVLGLEGKYREGEDLCKKAIQIWRDRGLDKQISRAEIALASIWRDRGQHNQAIDLVQQAIARLEEPEDSEMLVRGQLTLAWILWYKGVRTQDRATLERSRAVFEHCHAMARRYYIITELPAILSRSASVYWLLGEKERARKLLSEAYERSQEVFDIHHAVSALVGMAEFDYEEGNYEIIPRHARTLQKQYERQGYDYPLYFGRIRRIQANVAFERGEQSEALRLFAEGIALIKRHGGYAMYSIHEELAALSQRLQTMPQEQARRWILYLKDDWNKQQPAETFSFLISWCEQQIVDVALQLNKR